MTATLAGRRAQITAGASGIGLAIASTFHAAGARVLVCDVDAAALERTRAAHPDWGVVTCDVSCRDQVGAMFDGAAERFDGALDILVNNAGIAGPTGGIETLDPEDWARTIAINLTGVFLVTRRALPLLCAAGGGGAICQRRTPERRRKSGVAELSVPAELSARQIIVVASATRQRPEPVPHQEQ